VGNQVLPIDDPDIACGRPDVALALYCSRISLAYSNSFNSPV